MEEKKVGKAEQFAQLAERYMALRVSVDYG